MTTHNTFARRFARPIQHVVRSSPVQYPIVVDFTGAKGHRWIITGPGQSHAERCNENGCSVCGYPVHEGTLHLPKRDSK